MKDARWRPTVPTLVPRSHKPGTLARHAHGNDDYYAQVPEYQFTRPPLSVLREGRVFCDDRSRKVSSSARASLRQEAGVRMSRDHEFEHVVYHRVPWNRHSAEMNHSRSRFEKASFHTSQSCSNKASITRMIIIVKKIRRPLDLTKESEPGLTDDPCFEVQSTGRHCPSMARTGGSCGTRTRRASLSHFHPCS